MFPQTRSWTASRRAVRKSRAIEGSLHVFFTARAEHQIDLLHVYISARAGERLADGYVDRIVSFCQKLSSFPLRGTQRDDILVGLRTIGFERRATIAFVVLADAVLIEGIFYGGQDFERLLRDPA